MDKFKINEHDLRHIFSESQKPQQKFLRIIKIFLVFILIFIASFVIINFSAISSILSFWYKHDVVVSDNQPDANQDNKYTPSIINIPSSGSISVSKSDLPQVLTNNILIPKIDISAPITWRVSNSEPDIQKALENGVVQINGSSLPGQTGNVFITGHSSNYFWAKGNYKKVFSLLRRIVVGDLIYINYQNVTYIYRASSIKTVKPTNIDVLSNSTDHSYLTLMTCTPVGTSLNRLIIIADQISPDPSLNSPAPKGSISTMPQGNR